MGQGAAGQWGAREDHGPPRLQVCGSADVQPPGPEWQPAAEAGPSAPSAGLPADVGECLPQRSLQQITSGILCTRDSGAGASEKGCLHVAARLVSAAWAACFV